MITKKDVQYIAHLSRIYLKESEAEKLTHDLEGILGYIEKLNKLDVSQVKPTSHVLQIENVFRQDIVRPSLEPSTIMKFSVENDGNGSFKVPQVVE